MTRKTTLALALLSGVAGLLVYFWFRHDDVTEPASPRWFEDVTTSLGIDFTHDAGPTGPCFLPQIIGSGAAAFDANQDGRLDLLFLQNGGPNGAKNQFFLQRPDGKLDDASAGSGLDFAGHNMGVAVGDVNNDGWPDVLVTQFGGLKLLLNDSKGRFVEQSASSGVSSPYWGVSAAFVDFDRDGWLDLVVVNYVDYNRSITCKGTGGFPDFCHPNNYPGSPVKLFRNLTGESPKREVRFRDVSQEAGLSATSGHGLGIVAADFNGDGWPDLFVANDAQANHLWINQKNGTFKEEAVLRGLAFNLMGQTQGNMGTAWGDVDGDGLPDLFVSHLTEETHTLWRQVQPGQFLDQSAMLGIASSRWRGTGFGAAFADFDHDGWLDLSLVNGRVASKRANETFTWSHYAERNQLFANTGKGRFKDVSPSNLDFSEKPGVSRGLLFADLDNDGALDLVVTRVAAPASVYRNVVPNRGHWLMVQTLDPAVRRDAIGAELTLHVGGRKILRHCLPGQSYLCSNDPRVHFGLDVHEHYDRIEVAWSDGVRETFPGGSADRLITLRKGEGQR
jgi:hypothetical protein